MARLVIWTGPLSSRQEKFGFNFEVEIDLRLEGDVLWVQGEKVDRVGRSDSLQYKILQAFQESGWPRSIPAPLHTLEHDETFENFVGRPKSDQKLLQKISDSLKRLNKCCKGKLRFMRRGARIAWDVSPQVKKEVLTGVA